MYNYDNRIGTKSKILSWQILAQKKIMKYKLLFQIRFYLVIYTNVLPTYYFSMGMPMGTKTCPFIIAHVPTLVSFMKTKIHHDNAKFPQKPFSHLRFMLEAGLL